MNGTARYRRTAASISLIITAVLSVLWVALEPPFGETPLERLTFVGEAGDAAAISVTAFAVSQLFFIVGLLGVSHLLAHRSPKLAAVGGTLAVLGGFGHAVHAGSQAMQVLMASDTENLEAHATLLDGSLPLGVEILLLLGTLGTVAGLLILSIAVWKTRATSRWVPVALWAFILVEFIGSSFVDWASLVSALLYLGAFSALAFTVWRSPQEVWMSAAATSLKPEPARA